MTTLSIGKFRKCDGGHEMRSRTKPGRKSSSKHPRPAAIAVFHRNGSRRCSPEALSQRSRKQAFRRSNGWIAIHRDAARRNLSRNPQSGFLAKKSNQCRRHRRYRARRAMRHRQIRMDHWQIMTTISTALMATIGRRFDIQIPDDGPRRQR